MKPHPATSEAQIKTAYGIKDADQFDFVSGDFKDYLEKSNLLIMGGSSSTSMETLSKGIPVIIVGNIHGLTHNSIPETITSDIWRLCYSAQEISDAVQFYQTRSVNKIMEHEEEGRRIREDYFEPVTRGGVRKFLELEKY